MSKKIQDENGNTYVEVKPWYKKWWVWVLAVVVVIFLLGSFGGHDSSNAKSKTTNTSTTGSAKGHKTTKSETGEKSSVESKSKSLTVSYKDYDVSSDKTYSVTFSDSSWANTKVNVDKVQIYKLSKGYAYDSANDGKFNIQGFVKVHFNITAGRDISIYPTQGTAVFDNGEQHEADTGESWDGDISNGATKEGWVTFPIKALNDTSSIKSIRYKFDANYETDNYDDENSHHTYDFTLNLQ
ncbi:hypothetical protein [Liquorilactobacillus satsumensis]|uniref:hypothetical protein n=1 Tax=Liquorilactobacillus satsumensis TaxID=259059 RepID=UPI0039E83D0F